MAMVTKRKCRKNVRLSKRQIDFIDNLCKACDCPGSKKISRTAFIRSFLDVFSGLKVDVCGVKSEAQLQKRFQDAFCRNRQARRRRRER